MGRAAFVLMLVVSTVPPSAGIVLGVMHADWVSVAWERWESL